jgi:hypothetical protein
MLDGSGSVDSAVSDDVDSAPLCEECANSAPSIF